MSAEGEFWIVRAGEARKARDTKLGIQEFRREAGQMVWRLLPYTMKDVKRYASYHEAAIAADAQDAMKRIFRRRVR